MSADAAEEQRVANEPGVVVEYARAPEAGADDEVAAGRLALPGVQSAVCYRQQEDRDSYAIVYELDHYRVLDDALSAPAGAARGAGSAGGGPLGDGRDVRVYRQVGWGAVKAGYPPNTAPIALIVGMTMEPGNLDELVEWYEQEHMPMLLKVPGWQRMRRFLKVAGAGPEHLAICELAAMDVFDHPDKLAAFTPWREQVIQNRTEYERVLYDAWKRYPPAAH